MPRRKDLYLVVHNPRVNAESFQEVAREVERVAPHIRARVIRNKRDRLKRWARTLRPTLTVSMVPLDRLRPVRGPVITGKKLGKFEDMERLEAAGIPVPRWKRILPGEKPDLPDWGSHVLVKPVGGARGAGIRVMRRGRVRHRDWGDDLGERFAQEFIYTGDWPVAYRVGTLFGRPLFCLQMEGAHDFPALAGADRLGDHGGISVVASRRGCTYRPAEDPEVVDLAVRACQAFPDVPLLGFDVIREQGTGRLFVVESNPAGWTWLISSEAGREIQKTFGFSIRDAFGAIEVAARALAEETDARAR